MSKPLHPIQQRMIELAPYHNVSNMRLVDLARLTGVKYLQQVKHHREMLVKKDLLPAYTNKRVRRIKVGELELLAIPILGTVS